MFDAPAEFEKVTRAQVQSVAHEILDRRKRTVGVLLPADDSDEGSDHEGDDEHAVHDERAVHDGVNGA